MPMPGCLAQNR